LYRFTTDYAWCLNVQHLLNQAESVERRFLEHGMHAMQRRSGGMTTMPDLFLITSLDVVIHHDKKVGEGGFGQVYEADWQGNAVAVKVLEKGIPPSVSLPFTTVFPSS
jgi:predicted unusual protein kinase regulating ubiquinone biosynthesis (AarF/ABC1/UbiB family)